VLPLGAFDGAREDDVVVLLYHRVGAGDREVDLDADVFDRQMAALAATGRARTLDDALAPGATGGIVVTVDDGLVDFHRHVVPALVRHGVPALLYLATGLVANGGRADPDALTWDDLREDVATGLVTVGAHTHTHADLSKAPEDVAREEMRRSKELVEERLGVPCRHFAYPWAVASAASERVAPQLFESAALGWSTNRRARLDPYRLGRTPVLRSDGSFFFRAKLAGRLDKEALVYRVLRRGPWRAS
jgi:peptidoglycan/xylan/chitin deacetylase (PgdA/CDA1 family)